MDRVYVMSLVRSFECGFITRREFMTRATIALGSLTTANVVLAACSPSGTATPEAEPMPTAGDMATPLAATEAVQGSPEPTSGAATTDEEGLLTETVDYEDVDGEVLMGYLARPDDMEQAPAVIVLQEWWGLDEHIKDVTRRIAREGYVALAPDLYHGAVVDEPTEARKLVMELDQEEAVTEIRQAVAYLASQNYVAGNQVGVVGFCMGGGLALQTSIAEPDLGAAVAFYGSPLTPDRAPEVQAPVLGLYGRDDGGIAVTDVEAMDEALDAAGVENEVVIYDGAGHAFFNDTRDSYNADAASDAWSRMISWFEQHLTA